jgi:hypothetical protein
MVIIYNSGLSKYNSRLALSFCALDLVSDLKFYGVKQVGKLSAGFEGWGCTPSKVVLKFRYQRWVNTWKICDFIR